MPEKEKMKNPEIYSKCGRLIVLSGRSGAGKDTIIEKVLEHPDLASIKVTRLVTYADRKPRIEDGEIDGVHYNFVSSYNELTTMYERGELVEFPVETGSSHKATPKSQFYRIIEEGANLLWRVETGMASKVATGEFFEEQFPDFAEVFKKITIVCFITAKTEDIEKRRRLRDGEKFNPKEYIMRDSTELPFLPILEKHAHLMENNDGCQEKCTEEVIELIKKHVLGK